MANKLEQKIGEVLGLEMAAQKAVEVLSAKGLLDEAGTIQEEWFLGNIRRLNKVRFRKHYYN